MTIRDRVERIRDSLFLVPAALIVASVALAWATTRLDGVAPDGLPLLPAGVVGARSILSTIAGATITVAAIVFSITAVAVQLASTQYSPRVVGGLFRDSLQQWVIGVVVGTFTFSLTALALGPGTADPDGVAPRVTVTVAVALAVASMLLIVGFIDRTTRSITVSEIVRRIAGRAEVAAGRTREPAPSSEAMEAGDLETTGGSVDVEAEGGGWVRRIDAPALARALPAGATVRLADRVGSYVSEGDVIATVWPETAVDGEVAADIRRSVVLGRFRDPEADAGFAIRQLVDIALRALSPGVNDPTTAVDVLQHLRGPMRTILFQPAPRRVFVGESGAKVVVPEELSRADHVWAAFTEIRLASDGQPEVTRALLDVLADLIERLEEADLADRAGPLREQARMAVEAAGRHGYDAADLERVLRPARRIADPATRSSR